MPQTGSRSILLLASLLRYVVASLLRSRSPQMRVNQFEQLVVHRLGFSLPAAAQGFRGAMAEVTAHEVAPDTAQRFLHTGDLGDDVRAVAVVFDHFLQAADLAFDAAKPVTIGSFDFRIDGRCFARAGVARASSTCSMSPFTGCRHLVSPKPSYTPYPHTGKRAFIGRHQAIRKNRLKAAPLWRPG